ncbi:MAG TPA: 50S ribosomal protein L32 [Ktedonobacterales bacterium]
MGALPKKRVSNHRQGNRRRYHVVKLPALSICQQCKQAHRTHHVCPECGTYRGMQVLPPKTEATNE